MAVLCELFTLDLVLRAAAFGDGDRTGSDHAGLGGAAGVLLQALLLSEEHRSAAVPDCGRDAREAEER